MTSDSDPRAVFRQCFEQRFQEMISSKDINSFYLSAEHYREIVADVKRAKASSSKTKKDYRRLKRFEVSRFGDLEKLIAPVPQGESNVRYFVTNEEMFDILYDSHIALGHGGKHKMLNELNITYKNVTQDAVRLFLSLCSFCQVKLKPVNKKLSVKPEVFEETNSRGQVDVIDMQTIPDESFKFIMVYQDYHTKFVQLRPLESQTAEEICKHLVDIFCIFGAPALIQSDNGREFVIRVVSKLRLVWDGLNIVLGDSHHSRGNTEKTCQDVQNILSSWMADSKSKKWSEGLRFVQLMKNKTYHDEIKRYPFQAMFGRDVKIGIASSFLSQDVLSGLLTEEELVKALQLHSKLNDTEQNSEAVADNVKDELQSSEEQGNDQIESAKLEGRICGKRYKETDVRDHCEEKEGGVVYKNEPGGIERQSAKKRRKT